MNKSQPSAVRTGVYIEQKRASVVRPAMRKRSRSSLQDLGRDLSITRQYAKDSTHQRFLLASPPLLFFILSLNLENLWSSASSRFVINRLQFLRLMRKR